MTTTVVFIWLREDKIANAANMAVAHAGTEDVIVYTEKCDLRYTAAVNWNRAIDKVKHFSDNICIMGDDCYCQLGWLANALEAMKQLDDEWGMVNLNDGTNIDRTSHVVFDKRCLDLLGGKLLHEGYYFACSDIEMQERMIEQDKWIYAQNALAIHHHPMIFGNVPSDKYYEMAYAPEKRQKDRELLVKRRESGWTYEERKVPAQYNMRKSKKSKRKAQKQARKRNR
jgi:hypothetical protein